MSHDLDADQEREVQLVLLEQPSANILVAEECDELHHVLQPDVQVRVLLRHFDTHVVQPLEVGQRVLVHVIHKRQVCDHKVDD